MPPLWCWITLPVIPLSDLTNNVDEWIVALVDNWDWTCSLMVKKPGWASTWYANFWDLSQAWGNIYNLDWTLTWNRVVDINNQILSFLNWEVRFWNGTPNDSWVTLNNMSPTAPKLDCWAAWLLGYDFATRKIVRVSNPNWHKTLYRANDGTELIANWATQSATNPFFSTGHNAAEFEGAELSFDLDCESEVLFTLILDHSFLTNTFVEETNINIRTRMVIDWVGDISSMHFSNEVLTTGTNATSNENRKMLHLSKTLPAGTHTMSYVTRLLIGWTGTQEMVHTQVQLTAQWNAL